MAPEDGVVCTSNIKLCISTIPMWLKFLFPYQNDIVNELHCLYTATIDLCIDGGNGGFPVVARNCSLSNMTSATGPVAAH